MGSRGAGGAVSATHAVTLGKADHKKVYTDILNSIDKIADMQVSAADSYQTARQLLSDRAVLEQSIQSAFNPRFNEDRVFQTNCALCSMAIELSARGYDVQARRRDRDMWRGFINQFQVDLTNHDSYYAPCESAKALGYSNLHYSEASQGGYWDVMQNPNKLGNRNTQIYTNIENAMQKWGAGSRAEIMVNWKGSRAWHSMLVVNTGKHVAIVDGQSGSIYTGDRMKDLLSQTVPSRTVLMRTDNLKLRDDAQVDKIVTKRRH